PLELMLSKRSRKNTKCVNAADEELTTAKHNTMTTPCPTHFLATTPRAGILVSFVIISNSKDEITTLPVRPAPPSSDRIPTLSGYPLDFGDDSSDKDLSETVESLHTQTALTLIVHPPSTRILPTTMPLPIPSSSSPLLPLSPSSYLQSPSLLPSSSCRRSRLPLPSLPQSVSPSPSPSPLPSPPTAVPPPPEYIKSVRDDIETLRVSLAFAMQETMTVCARVRHDIEVSRARAEAAEQRAETLQVSLGANRIDVKDLIESCEADRLHTGTIVTTFLVDFLKSVLFTRGDAVNFSGGTMPMWDSCILLGAKMGTHYVYVIGKWNGFTEKIAVINIYGPQESRQKEEL
nr:hypothetical protein [Tanacetum cinerariifolium]